VRSSNLVADGLGRLSSVLWMAMWAGWQPSVTPVGLLSVVQLFHLEFIRVCSLQL
jgi:hypothetical protein